MRLSNMLRRLLCLALACLLLAGCAGPKLPGKGGEKETLPVTEPATEPTEPAPTAPPDGVAGTITEKGSYTGTVSATAPVATAGAETLTGDRLQLYYGLMAATWRAEKKEPAPDWNVPLDVQVCPIEGEAVTWQQFFLQQALAAWHLHVALVQDSADAAMTLDPDYKPNLKNHETYLEESMPAYKVLYGKDPGYKLNDLNKAFIDSIPDLLTELGGADALAKALGGATVAGYDLELAAELINEAYAYFIWARKQAMGEEETVEGATVTFRHVLLIPEEGDWEACEAKAQTLLDEYLKQKKVDEPRFAVVANQNSQDEGSRLNGGLYEYVSQGQMNEALDAWLFDAARTPGETGIVRSDLGVHILYFRGWEEAPDRSDLSGRVMMKALERFPLDVNYGAIYLEKTPDEGAVTIKDLLYPDIAHEYITDYPLYLQQDFPETMYGNFPLITYGCGITTLAMFASYMTDEWLTPPELAGRYGHYCFYNGTDVALITDSAPELGYFVHNRFFDWRIAPVDMDAGYEAMCLQQKGYFTRGGHYLILRYQYEDDTLSIRDSNIYNYGKLHPHGDDHFKWTHVTPAGAMYWTFEPKITRIPACWRCGDETGLAAPEGLLLSDYTCSKCLDAMARTEDFLNFCIH